MDAFAAFGYAAQQIIINAVTITNSTNRAVLVRQIAQGDAHRHDDRTYSFTAFGDPLQPQLYYYTLKDGKFTYLKQARSLNVHAEISTAAWAQPKRYGFTERDS